MEAKEAKEAQEAQYAELIKLFAFVLNQLRLYSDKHPAAQLAGRDFSAMLQVVLELGTSVICGFVEGRLVINDCSFDSKTSGVRAMLNLSQELQIEKLIFEPGSDEQEVKAMLNLMALPPKTVEARGGFKKVFEEANFVHIRLGTARHLLLGEDEEVVSRSKNGVNETVEEDPPQQVQKTDHIEELIEHCIERNEATIEFDADRIVYDLERRVQESACQMVRRAEDVGMLRRIVDGIVYFLEQRLSPKFIEKGKDISLPIYRLAREYRKALGGTEGPEDFKGMSEELGGILERCADSIKLNVLTRAFVESGSDPRSLSRFLRTKEAHERLREPLKERLSSLGVSQKDFEQIFAVQAEARVLRRARQANVTPEELEELRRIRDHFEEELARRVQQQTTLLERGLGRALDEKERMDHIIRNIGEGLVVVDNDGKVQLMNPAAERLLGMDQGESKGSMISQIMKDEHLLALAKGPLRDDSENITKEIELSSVSDETRRVLQASTAVIENEDGKTVGVVAVLSDITKQKKLDEMKSKFVAHVSHELRTPLLAMEESLGLLLGGAAGEISPDQEKFLSIGHRNIGRLSRLINDLLDVAKLEAGKMELHPITFEINDMVHHVSETVRTLAEGKGVTIEEIYSRRGVEVEADADRLTQVVTNLLGNAIKFTPEGGKIILEVDTDRLDLGVSQDSCVAISVKDTGPGIPLEEQKRIFNKFEQG
ncbi:MAG: histidine kinase dimerization/phospho-acceptor domain-containing protein, partial [Candidatus Binatia bacterium]